MTADAKVLLMEGPHNGKRVPDPETPAQEFTINGVTGWYYRDLNAAVPAAGDKVLGVYRHLENRVFHGGPHDTDEEERCSMEPGYTFEGDGVSGSYVRTTEVEELRGKKFAVYVHVDAAADPA